MHEASIAQAIVRSVSDVVIQNGRSHATRIHLQIGEFTAVVPQALLSSFRWVAQGTPCEDAALEIEDIPIRFRCEECQSEVTMGEVNLVCPNCHSHRLRLLSGRELLIKSVEAE